MITLLILKVNFFICHDRSFLLQKKKHNPILLQSKINKTQYISHIKEINICLNSSLCDLNVRLLLEKLQIPSCNLVLP